MNFKKSEYERLMLFLWVIKLLANARKYKYFVKKIFGDILKKS